MKITNKISLKSRIFNLIGIVILIILSLYIIVVIIMRQMVQDNLNLQNESLIDMTTDQIQDTIETPVEFIEDISVMITNKYLVDGKVATDYLETIQKSYPYVSEIHIVSNDGYIINTAPYDKDIIGNSIIFEPYYKKGQKGEHYWSEVYISSKNGSPKLSLTIPEENYLIIADFDLSELPITLNQGLSDEIKHISILDQWGTYIVADEFEKVESRYRYELFDELNLKELGNKEIINDQYNVGYKKIEGLNWYIVFEFNNDKIYQDLNGFTIVLFAIWGMIAIVVFFILRRYFKDVNYELATLQDRAISFIKNGMHPSNNNVEMKFVELSHLNDDFTIMMKMILERQTEILTMNSSLESTVLERTSELEEMNSQLEEEIQGKEVAEEEIRRINESLDQQVKIRTEELEFLNGVLRRSVQRAEEANEAKTRFLAVMSHEMRTPLNGILGYVQILISTELDQEQTEIVSLINGSSRTLVELINDILDVEKYSVGKMIFEEETVNLSRILRDSIKVYQALVENKGLGFEVVISNSLDTEVVVDRMKINQLLGNLLSNALKFTSKGKIYVKCIGIAEESMVDLHIDISDTGIGIKNEVKPYLFSPFTQADGNIAKEFGGTGLGLTICKEIVTHYEGGIDFESTYGLGTTFFVNLKLLKSTNVEQASKDIILSMNHKQDIGRQCKAILVVEDNVVNQKLMSKFLEKYKIDYDITNNGKDAIEMLHVKKFDLILMDCQMPIMDGFEATKIIRKEFGTSIKIIAMTAYSSQEVKNKCLESGMDEYISKPIDLDKLVDIIGMDLKDKATKKQAEQTNGDGTIDKEAKILMQKLPFDYDSCVELVETYINQMHEGLQEIDKIIRSKDYSRLRNKIHQLKGASGAARQEKLMKKFENMELLAANDQMEDLIDYLNEIKKDQLFKV